MRATPPRTAATLAALALVLTPVLAGCGGSSTSASRASSAPATAPNAPMPNGSSSGSTGGGATSSAGTPATAGGPSSSRRGPSGPGTVLGAKVTPVAADVIRTGSIHLRVADGAAVTRGFDAARSLAGGDGGFVASSNLTSGRRPTAMVTLRIPSSSTAAATDSLERLGTVTSAVFGGTDVTGQVVDLTVEIANLRSEEGAVRKLLGQAPTVKDILTIQQELFSLQGQIQTLVAQQGSLDNQVTYATLTVTLTTSAVPVHHRAPRPAAPASTLSRFWHLASSHTVAVARSVVLAVGWSAPAVVVAVAAGGVWLGLRRRRHHGGGHEPTPSGP